MITPPTSPLIAELEAARSRLLRALLSRNTERGYRYDMAGFTAWCQSFDRSYLPASEETVSLYVTAMLTLGRKVSTVARRASAIARYHRVGQHPAPVTSRVWALMHGCRRLRCEQPRQKKALTVAELRATLEALKCAGGPCSLRNRAILVLGFSSALRRSSLADLIMEDVEIDQRGVILRIRREKQDQEGINGRLIGMPYGQQSITCAVRSLRSWLTVRGWAPGPLFTRMDTGSPPLNRLTPEAIGRIVKRSVKMIGLDPREYGAHSMRAGFITAAGESGVSDLLIADHTGHSSMSVLRRYFRRSELFRANACTSIGL